MINRLYKKYPDYSGYSYYLLFWKLTFKIYVIYWNITILEVQIVTIFQQTLKQPPEPFQRAYCVMVAPVLHAGGFFVYGAFFADLWHGATAPALTRKGAVGKSCHCQGWACAVRWSLIRSAECFAAPYLCHEPKPNISRALGALDLIYRRLDLRDPGLSSCVVVIYVWVEGSAPCHYLKRRKVSPAGDVLFLVAFIGSCSSLSPLQVLPLPFSVPMIAQPEEPCKGSIFFT